MDIPAGIQAHNKMEITCISLFIVIYGVKLYLCDTHIEIEPFLMLDFNHFCSFLSKVVTYIGLSKLLSDIMLGWLVCHLCKRIQVWH